MPPPAPASPAPPAAGYGEPAYVAGQGYAAAPALSLDYAQWSTRVFGYLIDMVVVGAIVGVLFLIPVLFLGGLASLSNLGPDAFQGTPSMGCCLLFSILPLASLGVGIFNKVYLVARRGSSIGQGVMKIKVVNGQGNLLTQGTAFVRLLAHIGLSFIPLGGIVDLLWPLWDTRRQTLHDKAVSCYVVHAR